MLLIGGGGTLGNYTAQELLRQDCKVDVICLEDRASTQAQLQFYQAAANDSYLTDFLKNRYYDGIVNFIHYTSLEAYRPIHALLAAKTDHLVYLSSYRVYADLQHPITENAPLLYDTVDDDVFRATEDYAVPKTKIERFLRGESGTSNWTIVRPVISFSDRRLDVVTRSGHEILQLAQAGKVISLPEATRNLTAGLDWAGNSGKLIARVVMSDRTLGETYTVSSAQNRTWAEVADMYAELLNARFAWVSTEQYLKDKGLAECPYILKYDRLFDRAVDNTKILTATGLCSADFTPIRDGIRIELSKITGRAY